MDDNLLLRVVCYERRGVYSVCRVRCERALGVERWPHESLRGPRYGRNTRLL